MLALRLSLWLIFTIEVIFTASGVYSAGFSRPSYHQGFARSASESQYPGEWRGLIGAWIPSLGPTGDTLYDWSGFNDNDGALTSMDPATDWVISGNPRLPGYALDFDGADDRVILGSDASIDDIFVGGATVTLWIHARTVGESGNGRVIDKSLASGVDGGWTLLVRDANPNLRFGKGWTTTDGIWDSPADSIVLNTWQHVAVTYNEGSTANDAIIYIDGQDIGTTRTIAPDGTPVSDAALDLQIGNFTDSRTFDGFIDDVRIYSRELTAAEISVIQNQLQF